MICIISDTHENDEVVAPAIAIIKSYKPELVVHCGDIISPPMLDHFIGLPMRFVFGNNDGETIGLRNRCQELGFGEINDTLEIEFKGKRIFAYHGTNSRALQAHIDSQQYDYIFTGHTHSIRNEKIGKCRVINPGAMFRAKIYSFAVLDIDTDKASFFDAETGNLLF